MLAHEQNEKTSCVGMYVCSQFMKENEVTFDTIAQKTVKSACMYVVTALRLKSTVESQYVC